MHDVDDAQQQHHGLRLVVWDATGHGTAPWQRALTWSWRAGSRLYRTHPQAAVDDVFGARSWSEALAWLACVQPAKRVREVQYWGHGLFGRAFVGNDVLDERSVRTGGAHHDDLLALRARLVGDDALVWLRTCSAFGGARGHRFARTLVDVVGCRVAGHTHVIGPLQSGLHSLRPGQMPQWSADEGVRDGDETRSALSSSLAAPHTITCLHGTFPRDW
jgi:hypothetical protein